MDNNSIYPNNTPEQPQQQVYQQQVYQQPVYQQPVQPAQAYSYNPASVQPAGTKCPGKEITGLVLGISSLVQGIATITCGWIPIYGIIYAIIFGLFGIGTGVAVNILHKKVHEEATIITKKIETGKKLSVPGIILSAVGIGLSITIGIIVCAAIGTAAGLGSLGASSDVFGEILQELY